MKKARITNPRLSGMGKIMKMIILMNNYTKKDMLLKEQNAWLDSFRSLLNRF